MNANQLSSILSTTYPSLHPREAGGNLNDEHKKNNNCNVSVHHCKRVLRE